MPASRWEHLLWPRWLPETARLPLIAQITGAVALTALLMGPWWSRVNADARAKSATAAVANTATLVPPTSSAERPAHLNLEIRHSFASVAVSVTVDGQRALDTTLEGNGRKFKMFGKRNERTFTRTLDLQPGARVVRVRMQSPEDRFDQTRVERFDLASAMVADLRITADKSNGLVAIAHRPSIAPVASSTASAHARVASVALPATPANPPPSITRQADALGELLNSLRSILIAIAGFVASAATGFVVQEYLRSKRRAIFPNDSDDPHGAARGRRRRSHVTPAVE